MDIIERQIYRWKNQAKKSNLPDEVYELVSTDTSSKLKRVVSNLARVSRIIDDDGSIRKYDDFKHDWKFSHASIGEANECYLCGKKPIFEHCILTDEESGINITVGNVCVNSFLAITDDEKDLIRSVSKEYRAVQKRSEFASAYPNAMQLLKEHEDMMVDDSELKILYKTMTRRLVTHGYPGDKTRKKWDDFVLLARELRDEWDAQQLSLEQARQERMREEMERQNRFQQEITNRRNRWFQQSLKWRNMAQNMDLNSWERRMVVRVANKIQMAGESSLKDGHKAFFDSLWIRHEMLNPDFECADPRFHEILSWLDQELNDWTQSFCVSLLVKIVKGEPLTEKQESMLISTRRRMKE